MHTLNHIFKNKLHRIEWHFVFTLFPVLLCIISIAILLAPLSCSQNVAFEYKHIKGASIYVITADLNDPKIKVDIGLPEKGIAHSESFRSMIKRRLPIAAVTGTYFDTKSLLPVGSIIRSGKAEYNGCVGTAVCFLKNADVNESYSVKFIDKKRGDNCDWNGVECGLRTGPRLLANGYYALNPRREGFRDRGLFGLRTRVAMGVTAYNKLLLVAVKTPVTFARITSIMKALGAVDAVCLDGGTSSAMYYRGRLVQRPGRNLTNIFEIHENAVVASAAKGANYSINRQSIFGHINNKFMIGKIAQLPIRPAINKSVHCRPHTYNDYITYHQFAVLNNMSYLSYSKRFHTFIPVYRAKLTGLKSFNNSKNFAYVTPNVQIMHHLVS